MSGFLHAGAERLRAILAGVRPLAAFDVEHPCVFVLSTGRVGTQTLASLFGKARNLTACHEPEPLLYDFSRRAYEADQMGGGMEPFTEAFMAARRKHLEHALRCGRGYLETSPQTTFLAPAIIGAVPEVRFLHVVRNPQEVIRSGMRRRWYDGHTSDPFRITPRPGTPCADRWHSMTPFEKNAWLWNETNQWILKFTATLPETQHLMIHAERIFSADESCIEQLFSFLGAFPPPRSVVEATLRRRLNAQRSGSFPTADEWSVPQCDTAREVCGETAHALGYREDLGL